MGSWKSLLPFSLRLTLDLILYVSYKCHCFHFDVFVKALFTLVTPLMSELRDVFTSKTFAWSGSFLHLKTEHFTKILTVKFGEGLGELLVCGLYTGQQCDVKGVHFVGIMTVQLSTKLQKIYYCNYVKNDV